MSDFPKPALRAALYARVSTEEQREGQTIDSQIAELERFAGTQNWPIVGTYKDDGWSGGVMERPELDRLRDDAQKGLFDAVLINDVDRLARDVAHLGVIKRDLERKGTKVIFRKLPTDTSPTSNLMVNILGSFAEFERELISDRTRRGRRHKVEARKQYLGSNTAYGYCYIPMDRRTDRAGILEINPKEALVVRSIFEWVDREGLSARRVVKRLNERGIPPRKGAAKWAKSSLLRILRSEMYAGVWHYNKFQGCEPKNPLFGARYRKRTKSSVRQRPRTEWLPLELPQQLRLVPRDRWERVQRQLDRNITFSPRNEKHAYLLKGLVQCDACGKRFVGDPNHGKYYYRCSARCGSVPSVRESLLDAVVQKAVSQVMVAPDVILDPLRQLEDSDATEQEQQRAMAAKVDREMERLTREEDRILEVYRTGIITPAQLGQQLESLKAQRDALVAQQAELHREPSVSPEQVGGAVVDYCAEAAKNLREFTADQWREFLRIVVQRIEFRGAHIKIVGRIPVGQTTTQPEAAVPFQIPARL